MFHLRTQCFFLPGLYVCDAFSVILMHISYVALFNITLLRHQNSVMRYLDTHLNHPIKELGSKRTGESVV